jgi:hypothetical protein
MEALAWHEQNRRAPVLLRKIMDTENIVTFEKARREGSHVLISMEATSGRGKTLSALLLGRGLVGPEGKLGLLDTETGRGKIYAESIPGGYQYGELTPPLQPGAVCRRDQERRRAPGWNA